MIFMTVFKIIHKLYIASASKSPTQSKEKFWVCLCSCCRNRMVHEWKYL